MELVGVARFAGRLEGVGPVHPQPRAVPPDALRAEIEARLRDLGCPKLNLIVWDDNTYAMRFWEALGYRREKTVEYAKEL